MSRYSSPESPPPELDPKILEEDYLQYIIDECELNEWQQGAYPDMLAKLSSGAFARLTEKQRWSVRSAAKQFDLKDDISKGFLYCGYHKDVKSGKAGRVVQLANPAPKPTNGFDDMDDDIPF